MRDRDNKSLVSSSGLCVAASIHEHPNLHPVVGALWCPGRVLGGTKRQENNDKDKDKTLLAWERLPLR